MILIKLYGFVLMCIGAYLMWSYFGSYGTFFCYFL